MKKLIFLPLALLAVFLVARAVIALDGSGWEGAGEQATYTGNKIISGSLTTTGGSGTITTDRYFIGSGSNQGAAGLFVCNTALTDAIQNILSVYGKPAIHSAGTDISVVNATPDLSNNHTGGAYNVVRAGTLTSADTDIAKNVISVGAGWDNIIVSTGFSVTAAGNLNSAGTGTFATGGSTNHTVCWKAGGLLGYCSSIVGADGTCTCN